MSSRDPEAVLPPTRDDWERGFDSGWMDYHRGRRLQPAWVTAHALTIHNWETGYIEGHRTAAIPDPRSANGADYRQPPGPPPTPTERKAPL